MKIETQKVIQELEWSKFVSETYGRPYNYQQQNDCRDRGIEYLTVPSDPDYWEFINDTVPEEVNGDDMGVSFKAWLERDPKQPIPNQKYDWELGLWWKRNFYPSLQSVANDLHSKGLLEAGEYTINIDW